MAGNSVRKVLEFSIKADLQHEIIEAQKLALCETPVEIAVTMQMLTERLEYLLKKYQDMTEQLKNYQGD